MLNYYDDYKESREFIEHYEIVGNDIIIHLGTGEIIKKCFTEDNLKEIITKMHVQALNGKKHIRKFIKRKMYFTKYIVNFAGLAAAFIAFGLFLSPHTDLSVTLIALGIGSASLSGLMAALHSDTKVTIDDIKKNEEFIKIEEEVKEILEKYGKTLFIGTSKQTRELANNEGFDLDLNTLNKLSLEDLLIIRENLIRLKSYESITDKTTSDGKQITLNPTKKND